METSNAIDVSDLNLEIRLLWKNAIQSKKWPKDLNRFWPHQHPEDIKPHSLVFVGMNPAYTKADEQKMGEIEISENDISDLLDENTRSKYCKDMEPAKTSYGKHFVEIYKGTKFDDKKIYLDLFCVKSTNQNIVKDALGINNTFTEFAGKQIEIFMKLLKRIEPAIIIVPNACASRILLEQLKEYDLSSESPEDDGSQTIILDGEKIPIFFCGMLDGQHAMDTFSRQRLINQVRNKIANLDV